MDGPAPRSARLTYLYDRHSRCHVRSRTSRLTTLFLLLLVPQSPLSPYLSCNPSLLDVLQAPRPSPPSSPSQKPDNNSCRWLATPLSRRPSS